MIKSRTCALSVRRRREKCESRSGAPWTPHGGVALLNRRRGSGGHFAVTGYVARVSNDGTKAQGIQGLCPTSLEARDDILADAGVVVLEECTNLRETGVVALLEGRRVCWKE